MVEKKVKFKLGVKTFSIIIKKEGKFYVAWNPELDVADQGKTIEEAKSNLEKAIKFHMKTFNVEVPQHQFVGVLTADVKVPIPENKVTC